MASAMVVCVVFLFACMVTGADAMCMPEHPQTAVCRAHFVIKGKIIEADHHPNHKNCSARSGRNDVLSPLKEDKETAKEEEASFFKSKQVLVRIIKKFKGFAGKKINDIVTIESGSPWGPKLKTGKVYVLSGYTSQGNALMTMCNWYSLWKDLTYVQRISLRLYYLKFCRCMIEFCPDGGCPMKPNHCSWTPYREEIGDTRMDCQSKFGICISNGKRCIFYSPKYTYACKRGPSLP